VVPPSWTGFYIGANVGGAWANSDPHTSTVFGDTGYFSPSSVPAVNSTGIQSLHPSGFTGGIQAGYNWQLNSFLLGLEGDFEALSLRGSTSKSGVYPCCAPSSFVVSSSVSTDWLATIRGRAGFVAGNWLFYGTAGVAFSDVKASWGFSDDCGTQASCSGPGAPNGAESAAVSSTRTGWTAGAGVEAKLSDHWTWKAEYLYVDLGSVSATGFITPSTLAFFNQTASNPFSHSVDLKANIGRIGLNYKF
jgi:outer membrane immunogenic protein